MTRGTLLPWSVEEKIGHERIGNVRPTIQRPRSYRPEGTSDLHDPTFFGEGSSILYESGFRPRAQTAVHVTGDVSQLGLSSTLVAPSSTPSTVEKPSCSTVGP